MSTERKADDMGVTPAPQPFLLFISLHAALPQYRHRTPESMASAIEQLRRVMRERPKIRFVLIDDYRAEDPEKTRAKLLESGIPQDVADRLEDQTPLAQVMVNGEVCSHMVAWGVEMELYWQRTCKRLLNMTLHGSAILIDHALHLHYMDQWTVRCSDMQGLSKEAADRLIGLLATN